MDQGSIFPQLLHLMSYLTHFTALSHFITEPHGNGPLVSKLHSPMLHPMNTGTWVETNKAYSSKTVLNGVRLSIVIFAMSAFHPFVPQDNSVVVEPGNFCCWHNMESSNKSFFYGIVFWSFTEKKFFTGFLSYKRDCLRSLRAKIEQKTLGESCWGYPYRYWFFNKGFIQQTTLQACISKVLKPARLARIQTKNLLHLIFKTNWMTSFQDLRHQFADSISKSPK